MAHYRQVPELYEIRYWFWRWNKPASERRASSSTWKLNWNEDYMATKRFRADELSVFT